MSTVGLFLLGLFVTGLVTFAIGILIYGAVLDGRTQAEHEHRAAEE